MFSRGCQRNFSCSRGFEFIREGTPSYFFGLKYIYRTTFEIGQELGEVMEIMF